MSEHPPLQILKAFPHTHFYPEARLITWHPRGILDDTLADRIVDFLESEEEGNDIPFHRYTDFSALTDIHLRIGHTFRLAERRRDRYTGKPVKSAFFCDWIIGSGIANLYEALMAGGPIQVRAFRSREAAAAWLDVPMVILLPNDVESAVEGSR